MIRKLDNKETPGFSVLVSSRTYPLVPLVPLVTNAIAIAIANATAIANAIADANPASDRDGANPARVMRIENPRSETQRRVRLLMQRGS